MMIMKSSTWVNWIPANVINNQNSRRGVKTVCIEGVVANPTL
jgi:hypothetical protein